MQWAAVAPFIYKKSVMIRSKNVSHSKSGRDLYNVRYVKKNTEFYRTQYLQLYFEVENT